MEQKGAKFVTVERRDIRQRYTAALVSAAVFIGLMAVIICISLFNTWRYAGW